MVGNRAPYHHGDLRHALIQAALAFVVEDRNQDFTLREVARRAGVSHAAPYKHFSDKRELLAEVAALGFRSLRDRLEAAAAREPLDGLEASAIAYVTFAVEYPAHFRLMFGPAFAHDKPARLAEAGVAAFGALELAIDRCRAAGLVRDDDHGEVALAAWSLVHGLATLIIDGSAGLAADHPEGIERSVKATARVLSDGFRPRGAGQA